MNFDPTDPKVTGPLQKPVTRRWCEVSPRMWPLVRGTICLSILGARDIGTVKASKCQMVRRLDSQKSGWPEFQMAKIQFLYRWIFRVEPLFYPHFWHSCTKFCGRLSPLSPPSRNGAPGLLSCTEYNICEALVTSTIGGAWITVMGACIFSSVPSSLSDRIDAPSYAVWFLDSSKAAFAV